MKDRKRCPMSKNPTTDAELLKQCNEWLYYDPNTGVFQWAKRGYGIMLGKETGCLGDSGHLTIRLCGYNYLAHSLAFLITYKYIPEWPNIVEHKDGIGTNNFTSNLRQATNTQNQNNSGPRTKGARYKGVYRAVNWVVKMKQSPSHHLGTFNCEHYAARIWNTAARMYQGQEFCYTNQVESCDCLECN